MVKFNLQKTRGVAFQVCQETEHCDNPYTFQVDLSPTKVCHGLCNEAAQTQVEIYDHGKMRWLTQHSHIIVMQDDMLIGFNTISRTASRAGISLSTAALKKISVFRFLIVLQSRNSSDDFCQPPPHCPIAVYSPWKAVAVPQSALTPTPSPKPATRPAPPPKNKATTSSTTTVSSKPPPSSQRARMDLTNNLFKKPLFQAIASVLEQHEGTSGSIVGSAVSYTNRNAPQATVCKCAGVQHEQGPETIETASFAEDHPTSEATMGPPYDVHFYHADQNPTRSRVIAAHQDVLSVFPKLESLVFHAVTGRSIMRAEQELRSVGSSQAGIPSQSPVVVDISHFSYDAFRAMVVYVYTGDFNLALFYVTRSRSSPSPSPPRWIHVRHEGASDQFVDLYELRELLLICGLFDVDGLRYACIGTALSSLSAENAVFMLVHLGRDVKEIKRTVVAFIKDNFEDVAGPRKTLEELFGEFKDQDCSDLLDELKEVMARTP
ncbi:unnamed protein product [Mortierella alpina]